MREAILMAQIAERERELDARIKQERRRFEQQFNHLIAALNRFQKEYNASDGQVWPARAAAELKKAIKQLDLP